MTGVQIASCLLPDHLHWFSQQILDYYLTGRISTGEFLRYFHMPNSDYLPFGECIQRALDPGYDFRKYVPGILDGAIRDCPKINPACLT